MERRIKRTLVTVNLVSRRLVINRWWRKIDRYLLTADDSTFSPPPPPPVPFTPPSPLSILDSFSPPRRLALELDVARVSLVCGPVLGLLMNQRRPALPIRHRAWWEDC